MDTSLSLRDDPKQVELRKAFKSSFRRQPQASSPCQACCPTMPKTTNIRGWERGYISNEADDRATAALKCNNCGFIRTFTKRKRPAWNGQPNAAQQRTLDKIRAFFSERSVEKGVLTQWEITPTDYGTLWVSVKTAGNVYVASGAYIRVGSRGSVKVESAYDLYGEKKANIAHYQRMLE